MGNSERKLVFFVLFWHLSAGNSFMHGLLYLEMEYNAEHRRWEEGDRLLFASAKHWQTRLKSCNGIRAGILIISLLELQGKTSPRTNESLARGIKTKLFTRLTSAVTQFIYKHPLLFACFWLLSPSSRNLRVQCRPWRLCVCTMANTSNKDIILTVIKLLWLWDKCISIHSKVKSYSWVISRTFPLKGQGFPCVHINK